MRPIQLLLLALFSGTCATLSFAADATVAPPPRVLIIGKNGLSTNLPPEMVQPQTTVDVSATIIPGVEEITGADATAEPTPEPPAPVVPVIDWEPIVQAMEMMIEQQKVTLQSLEQSGRSANETSLRQTESMEKKLSSMEDALSAQRTHESDTINRMNRLVVGVAAAFAGTGFVVMVLTAWFFMRTMNKVAEINANVQSQLLALPHSLQPLVGPGGNNPGGGGGGQPGNQRLLGALEQLERRIRDLEHTSSPEPTEANGQVHQEGPQAGPTTRKGPAIVDVEDEANPDTSVEALLARGQTFMNLDEAEQALECFDAALQKAPHHAETLLKKGTALERLRRMHEALDAYDEAIRQDNSMTMAYLAKGGICNRLERYSEALECYEKALRAQQHSAA